MDLTKTEERTESDAVHPLTRITSSGDYVEIDEQAPQVLSAATNESERTGGSRSVFRGKFFFESVKSFVLSTPTSDQQQCYDTSNWDDVEERDEDCIAAKQVAKEVYCDILKRIPQISGYNYEVCKYRIVVSQDVQSGNEIRDYFLKIQIDAPNLRFLFVQVHQSCMKKLTLVANYLKSCPQ